MRFLPSLALLLLTLGLTVPASAAINPAHFQRVASDVLRLREISRIVHETAEGGDKLRRVTIAAVVVEVHEGTPSRVGATILIDFTVNLTARDRAAAEHQQRQGNMPGRQFLAEPEPPTLDAKGEFWAHLAKAGGRLGNVNRHAGAVVGIGDYTFSGEVFVPVGGPYSFMRPM
jgi:hypothetical protein